MSLLATLWGWFLTVAQIVGAVSLLIAMAVGAVASCWMASAESRARRAPPTAAASPAAVVVAEPVCFGGPLDGTRLPRAHALKQLWTVVEFPDSRGHQVMTSATAWYLHQHGHVYLRGVYRLSGGRWEYAAMRSSFCNSLHDGGHPA